MFVQKLAVFAVSLSSLFASSFALPPSGCHGCEVKYEDIDAKTELIKVYGGNEASIPKSLKESIGSCKFTSKTPFNFAHGGQPKFHGVPTDYIISKGTSNPKDTCIYFTGISFAPSLFTDQ